MRTMKIGKSDITATVVAMGAWAAGGGGWWGSSDDEAAKATVKSAVEHGVTLIDTAPAYGLGHSEKLIGEALEGIRDRIAISTKCGLIWDSTEGVKHCDIDGKTLVKNLTPESIRREFEASSSRLRTDMIDIYFTHWQSVEPFYTPIARTMECLMELKAKGKIRAIGASNVTAENIVEYCKHGQLDIIQEKYSLLDRRVEAELLPACKEYGITLQAYTPLEQGVLTGGYDKDYRPIPGTVRSAMKWFKPDMLPRVVAMVDSWEDLCEKYKCSRTQLVIAWLIAQGDNVNVLCGARKLSHLEDNIGGMDIVLEPKDAARLRADAEELSKK